MDTQQPECNSSSNRSTPWRRSDLMDHSCCQPTRSRAHVSSQRCTHEVLRSRLLPSTGSIRGRCPPPERLGILASKTSTSLGMLNSILRAACVHVVNTRPHKMGSRSPGHRLLTIHQEKLRQSCDSTLALLRLPLVLKKVPRSWIAKPVSHSEPTVMCTSTRTAIVACFGS